MEEQEEGRQYKNEEIKNDINTKMITTDNDFSEKLLWWTSRLLTIKSGLHVPVFHWRCLPHTPALLHALLHFHFRYEKQYPKASENWYIFLSIYIFCPIFNPGDKRKKLKGKKLHSYCPKTTETSRKCREKKREMINVIAPQCGAWYTGRPR